MTLLESIRSAMFSADKIESDQLITYIRDGRVSSTAGSMAFRGNVVVIITDWPSEISKISFALSRWVATNDPESTGDSITYEVDVINHDLVDVMFVLPFKESLAVDASGGTIEAHGCNDPLPDLTAMLPDSR